MLPSVTIDISEVANEFTLSETEISSLSKFILTNVADSYRKFILQLIKIKWLTNGVVS